MALELVWMPIVASSVDQYCTGVGTAGAAGITGIAVPAGVGITDAVVIGAGDGDAIGLNASIRGCH